MKNDNFLIEKNSNISNKRINYCKNGIYYKVMSGEIDGAVINQIILLINTVQKTYRNAKIPIIIDFAGSIFKDKLTYIILECICNYVINTCHRKIYLKGSLRKNIWTDGIISSSLGCLAIGNNYNPDKFKTVFLNEIYKRHYRRIISCDEWKDSNLNSKIMEDVDYFLKNLNVERDNRDKMAEVVSELAGNVHDHTDGDCLIDIDVTMRYEKKDVEGDYYGLNLVVLNFSNTLFGDGVHNKIQNDNILNDRHLRIREAYDMHKTFFDEFSYIEEDFYNIASFQHRISGRNKKESTGGTGLTKLIYSLEERSDTHLCYMISGTRAIWFQQDCLKYDNDNWIGFNNNNEFFEERPREDIIGGSYIYMPGTAFNLTFAMRKDDNI